MKKRDPLPTPDPEVEGHWRFPLHRKNLDPMEDKKRNTAEHNASGFYWVPICFSFFPAFFAFAFGLPLFPKTPAILIEGDLPVSSLSGYELMFRSPLSATFFSLTIVSWAYLTFVGVFTAFRPRFREVGKMNALLFPALVLLAGSTMAALFTMVAYVDSFDHSKTIPGYQPYDFVEMTYWALLIVPFLLLIWWIAVNLSNLWLQKKAAASSEESLEGAHGEAKGEPDDGQQE